MKKQMTEKLNQNKGITLIALVITIIVMLILVAVTISMAVNGGLFEYAGKAVGDTNNAINAEQQLINDIMDEYFNRNSTEDEEIPEEDVETIPTTVSYVGCYADIDSIEGIDGIIYADLAKGNTKGGKWANDEGGYSIPKETGLKEYYVSGTANGPFGNEKQVIKVVPATTGGKDRFYIMALEDVITADYSTFFWYNKAYDNMDASDTSLDFGTGKSNTEKIKGYWEKGTPYGAKNTRDLWSLIDKDSNRTWFVPSKGEWAAFAQELEITSLNYTTYGVGDYYWSSSQKDSEYAWYANFYYGYMTNRYVNRDLRVRLSATF